MSVAGDGVEPVNHICETTRLLSSHQSPPSYSLSANKIEQREESKCGRSFYWIIVTIVAIFLLVVTSLYSYFAQPLSPQEERKMYRNSGIYWGDVQPLNCLEAYHNRNVPGVYSALLQNFSHDEGFDMSKACQSLDIEIQSHTYESPKECRQQGLNMYGYWTVYDQQDCTIDDEVRKYRNSGMSWSMPLPAPHCHSYDKREYEAELVNIPKGYDWNKACRYIPIEIQEQTIEQPNVCERRGSSQYGKWVANNQLDCKPYWGPLRDVGCQASGKKRFEAPLWNLIEGDDWYGMCASTPAKWHGVDYEHPTNCDYRKRKGMVGIWDVEDCFVLRINS